MIVLGGPFPWWPKTLVLDEDSAGRCYSRKGGVRFGIDSSLSPSFYGSGGMKFRKSFLFVKFFVYARTIAAAEDLVYPGKARIYLPAESRMDT